jgi:uncharacterized surface protein with fasciclin (FAS1) repeats
MPIRRTLAVAASALVLAAALPTLAMAQAAPATVVDSTARTPELSTLNKLLDDSGLAQQLSSGGPYTLFAPSDEAFKAVPAQTLAELQSNPERLKAVLSYHVVPARLTSTEVQTGNVKTAEGGNLALSKSGSFVTVEDAVVTQADLPAGNGVVHVIDRVLTPPKTGTAR